MRLRRGKPLLDAEPRRLPTAGVWGIVELGTGLLYLFVAFLLTIILPLAAISILQHTTTLLPSLSLEELPPPGRAAYVLVGSL